jgi:hypothetical protein
MKEFMKDIGAHPVLGINNWFIDGFDTHFHLLFEGDTDQPGTVHVCVVNITSLRKLRIMPNARWYQVAELLKAFGLSRFPLKTQDGVKKYLRERIFHKERRDAVDH